MLEEQQKVGGTIGVHKSTVNTVPGWVYIRAGIPDGRCYSTQVHVYRAVLALKLRTNKVRRAKCRLRNNGIKGERVRSLSLWKKVTSLLPPSSLIILPRSNAAFSRLHFLLYTETTLSLFVIFFTNFPPGLLHTALYNEEPSLIKRGLGTTPLINNCRFLATFLTIHNQSTRHLKTSNDFLP